ncbi:hypothetical protein HPP92_022291 [Vanilla planifolia]|nr:hypothetical protein HPP92_022291 [Vanilla planifolia]
MPVILCGDWNGSKRGHVYKFLSSQGFLSSYDIAHQHNDSVADTDKWVSHRNHRGNICGVDFIWLFNPCKHWKPLRSSWNETLFEIVKYLLRQASLTERNAFAFLKADNPGGHITIASFCQALCQLGLTGHPNGLNTEEMEDLWLHADIDGKGYLDYGEFERIWNAKCLEKSVKMVEESEISHSINESKAFGFIVKSAALFPPEVENGVWPENYFLSDHAPLTVLFSPVRML